MQALLRALAPSRIRAAALALAAAAGCSQPPVATADLGAPDLAAPGPLTLTVDGTGRPLAAWYSFYVTPLPESGGGSAQIELVVTMIDPSYTCAAPPPAALDAVSFGFLAQAPGVDTSGVFSRSGPTLGPTSASSGWAELTSVDDRFAGSDGGAIFVGAGGSVAGEVHFQLGPGLRVDGKFTASHCAALDFATAA